jgi:integrase
MPQYVSTSFKRMIEEAGLPVIRFHDLRHSFGTIMASRLPPILLKEMMGHASITTTERYIHPSDEIFRLSMEKLLGPKLSGVSG